MDGCAPRVLVADDDPDTRDILATYLAHYGCAVWPAADGKQAWELAMINGIDLALLDVVMPGLSGLDLLEQLKTLDPAPEVILLTAFATVAQAVEAMKRGAFDYLTKPFQPKQVWATVQEAWAARQVREQFRVGEWLADLRTGRATREGETISLTSLETALLACLARRRGQVVAFETLRREVWGCASGVDLNAVWTAVHRLRDKLGPEIVVTVKGQGYLLPEAPKL